MYSLDLGHPEAKKEMMEPGKGSRVFASDSEAYGMGSVYRKENKIVSRKTEKIELIPVKPQLKSAAPTRLPCRCVRDGVGCWADNKFKTCVVNEGQSTYALRTASGH